MSRVIQDRSKPRALRRMVEILYGDPIAYKRLADDTRLPVFLLRKIVESHAGKQELGAARPCQIK